WLALRAEHDPDGAWLEISSLRDRALQRRAMLRLAEVWAASDPVSALARADRLPATLAPLAAEYRRRVNRQWARLDPLSLLAHLEATSNAPDLESRDMIDLAQWLAAADPVRALQFAESLPASAGGAMPSLGDALVR